MCYMDTTNPALKGLVCKEKIRGFHDTQLSAGSFVATMVLMFSFL